MAPTMNLAILLIGLQGLLGASAKLMKKSDVYQRDVKELDARCLAKLADPSKYQSPRFRWWQPGGWPDPDVIAEEVEALAAAGFGGAEIGDVEDSIDIAMDPEIYGWAQPRWNNNTLTAYEKANELGLHLDYTLGPHWPTGVPGYTPDSPQTSKELAHGAVLVSGGSSYSGALPVPIDDPSGVTTANPNVTSTLNLVAVLAATTNATSVNGTVIGFDQNSIIDLTAQASNGTITWTAPEGSPYVLVAVYGRGTGQIQNMYDMDTDGPELTYPFPAYIVDHFSSAGVQASVDYWNEHILSDEFRAQLALSNGSLFEDSLELKLTQYWTNGFMSEFKTRRGYDLTPYLLYVLQDTSTFSGNDTLASYILYDFYSIVSDLYIDYRLAGLKEFANSIGLKLRIQPYSGSFDSGLAASFVDIPEGESLGFEGVNDAFRVLAAGRDIAGRTTILSDELGAYLGKAYGVTWMFLIGTMNLDFSLGVSQSIIHGFPYRNSPNSLWPGFAPFTPLGTSSNGFADAWGTRQPQWMFANAASSYMARAQMLMQSGGPSVDLAILSTTWGAATELWDDTSLNDAGYSYQFPTPELLKTYNATVQDGRLIPDGPAYKALIINNITALNIDSAEVIKGYASAGLPIVVVGAAPSVPQSYCESCGGVSAEISAVFDYILGLNTSVQVESKTEAPAALASLGISPIVQYTDSVNATTTTIRRQIGENEYIYWIYADEATTQAVSFEGEGWPLKLDIWSGDIVPIGSFETANGYTTINISLAATSSEVYYLGKSNPYGASTPSKHATSVDEDAEVIVDGKSLYLRSTSNGTFSASLSSNSTKTFSFTSIPAAVTPSTWSLAVQDWAPAVINETGLNSSLTSKTWLDPITLTTSDGSLPSWPNITGLEYASGVGIYSTNVTISVGDDFGVYLDLGDLGSSWGLSINGVEVEGTDLFLSVPIDITDYVVDGENLIEVTVATTLWNKLIEVWPAIYGSEDPQDIGLLGPVSLEYYAQEKL